MGFPLSGGGSSCREKEPGTIQDKAEEKRAKQKAYRAAWYAKNREKAIAQSAAWARENPARCRETRRAWYERNRSLVIEKQRLRVSGRVEEERERKRNAYLANADLFKRRAANWAKENRDRYLVAHAARERKRAALKRNAPGCGVSLAEWRKVLAGSLGLCAYCNDRPARLEMDHIEPLAGGGAHDVDNIAAVCRSCNSSKGDTPLLVWLALRAARRQGPPLDTRRPLP